MTTTTRIRPTKLGYATTIALATLIIYLALSMILPSQKANLQDSSRKVQQVVVLTDEEDNEIEVVQRVEEPVKERNLDNEK